MGRAPFQMGPDKSFPFIALWVCHKPLSSCLKFYSSSISLDESHTEISIHSLLVCTLIPYWLVPPNTPYMMPNPNTSNQIYGLLTYIHTCLTTKLVVETTAISIYISSTIIILLFQHINRFRNNTTRVPHVFYCGKMLCNM